MSILSSERSLCLHLSFATAAAVRSFVCRAKGSGYNEKKIRARYRPRTCRYSPNSTTRASKKMQHTRSVMWDDELQRVATWLSSKTRQRDRQQTSVLARVNSHVQFVNAEKRDRELEAEEDDLLDEGDGDDDDDANDSAPEADLALNFLDGVNADDFKSLLEAEAARSSENTAAAADAAGVSTAASVSTAVVMTAMPEPSLSMALIEMPSHLLLKNSPPNLYASLAKDAQLQPRFVVPPPLRLPASTAAKVTVPATDGSSQEDDANVAELMNELDLDISDVAHHLPSHEAACHSDHEEHKTEESTPPHIRRESSEADHQADKTPSAMEALARSVFSSPAKANKTKQKKSRNVVRDGSDESDEGEQSVEHARSAQRPVDSDAVGDEMQSWVTGYRDPEVMRRKESMSQRSRRPTARFGVNSVEEQRYINKAAKYYAEGKDVGSSDSESSSAGSNGSDFSPDEVEDQDDPVSDVELLSDDYLDRETTPVSPSSKGKPRRRLRNQHKDSKATKKAKPKQKSKKPRAVKGASSVPAIPAAKSNSARENGGAAAGRGNVVENGSSSTKSSTKSSSNVREPETIDLLSSDDGSDRRPANGRSVAIEMRASSRSQEWIPRSAGVQSHKRTNGQSAAESSARKAKERESMILRLNLSKSMHESVSSASSTTAGRSVSQETATGIAAPHLVSKLSKTNKSYQAQSAAVEITADQDDDNSDAGHAEIDEDAADQALEYEVVDEGPLVANSAEVYGAVADVPAPSDPAATLIDQPLPASTTQNSDKALQMAEASLGLSEASLAKHNLLEISKAKSSESQEPISANKDEESEAETIDFDDVEQLSNDDDFDFGGDSSSRQDDLGFSDDDNEDASDDTPVVAAPHDEDYQQFFEDTPLRKLKAKQKQQQDQKQANASGAQSAQSMPTASTLRSKSGPNNAKSQEPKPMVPVSSTKNKVSVAAAAVVKEPTGSNGLRKTTKPAAISTSTVLKGKFEHSRRSIKVIGDGVDNFERGKRSVSGVYAANKPGAKKNRFSEPLVQYQESHSTNRLTEEFISSISSPERRPSADQRTSRSTKDNVASKSTRYEPDERYLSYGNKVNGTKSQSYDSDDEPLALSARGSKSRTGDKDSRSAATKNGSSSQPEKSSSWSFSSMVSSSNENVDSNPRAEKAPVFRRERQMDIYDALHIEQQAENGLTTRDLRDGEYKRPSAFKKVQEEKEKRGIAFVPREKFLENAPIPKKKKAPAALQQKPAPVEDQRKNGSSDKRSSPGKPFSRQKDSHYGPSSGDPPSTKKNNNSYDDRSSTDKYSSKNSAASSKNLNGKLSKNDKVRGRRSPSPVSRRWSNESDRYRFSSTPASRFKDDSDRGRRRDHSRSRSPLRKQDRYGSGADVSSSKRYRSLSRSRSRERDERSSSRLRIDDRDRSHSSKASRDSGSKREQSPLAPDRASFDSRKRTRSLDRNDTSYSPLKECADPNLRDLKRAKPEVDPRPDTRKDNGLRREVINIVPPPHFDYESDIYISDSDGEGDSKVPDIRLDLENVPVDQRQMRRRVYVSGINGMMDAEVLEDLFAPFGIEVRCEIALYQ